jgi:hypothetical protein
MHFGMNISLLYYFKLVKSANWIETTTRALDLLVKTGTAKIASRRYTLLDPILPIANLSVLDTQKSTLFSNGFLDIFLPLLTGPLGEHVVPLLMLLVTGKVNIVRSIRQHWNRGRQEASRVDFFFSLLLFLFYCFFCFIVLV